MVGPFELLRAAVPKMAERGFGRVVSVASIAGKRPSLFNLAYAVTKAAQPRCPAASPTRTRHGG